MPIKERRLGALSIIATDDGRLVVRDRNMKRAFDLTDKYRNRAVDDQLFDEIERKITIGEVPERQYGELVRFLKE